jgi:hypothetical protein
VAGKKLDRNDIKKDPGALSVPDPNHITKPVTKPTTSIVKTYKVAEAVPGHLTAADGKAKKNKKTGVASGTYSVFNESTG